MNWTPVNFGQYRKKPKTLPQIMFSDPDWFFWAYEKGAFKGGLATEARHIYRRARKIKVPQRDGQRMLVKYDPHYTGKFGTMQLIPDGPYLVNLNVSPVIDFKIPRIYAQCDKTGNKNFISALKTIYFGDGSKRMDKKACEDFFNDDSNFDLS